MSATTVEKVKLQPVRSLVLWMVALIVFTGLSNCEQAIAEETKAAQSTTAQQKQLDRSDVEKILEHARISLRKGKIKEAERLLQTAEQANISYPILHFGDTPSKLRRDLAKVKKAQPEKSLAKNEPASSKATQKNPFQAALPKTEPAQESSNVQQASATEPSEPSNLQPLPFLASDQEGGVEIADYRAALEHQAKNSGVEGIIPATSTMEVDLSLPDPSSNQPQPLRVAQSPDRSPKPLSEASSSGLLPKPESPFELLQAGENALRSGNRDTALQYFRQAYAQRELLDALSQEQLQDHLQMLSSNASKRSPAKSRDFLLDTANSERTVVARQLSAEIGKRQAEASKIRSSDPNGALKTLEEAKKLIAESKLDSEMQAQLTRRVDLSIAETNKYIDDNRAELELEAANRKVLDDLDREREVQLQVQQRLAELVEEFNKLRDEQRYAEMEIIAKRAYDMAPNDLVAQQIWENAKFIRRTMLNKEIQDITEQGVYDVLADARMTAGEALVDSTSPMTFAPTWDELTKDRQGSSARNSRQTESELEIRRKLRTKILPRYTDMPLAEVMKSLSDLSGVNIYLDPRGLSQEGVRSDTLVDLNLPQEISLESALTLILERHHLTYVVKNEVLKVTSEQISEGELITVAYNVSDLVVPIPNFVPSSSLGLAGLLEEAYQSLPVGVGAHASDGAVVVMGNQPGQPAGPMNGNVMPQQFGAGAIGAGNSGANMGSMPGSPGGAANADFDSLIDLIVSTVEHESWMENGTGEGEIQPFPTNLSLVISQTQRVHEQIADLLEQLRRLQDLQVTIEVRFIRLTDNFFERIGIDFDFNIEDGTSITDLNDVTSTVEPPRTSATVGITANPVGIGSPLGTFSADLDVPFRQESFGLAAAPGFAAPATVGQFGFAILSDIEAYFLVEASQADQRVNMLNAPKVTLFNGQQATVIDASQVPFVISVIPVVGEFAAAQQPVIVVLSEGTMMTVQAVVSDDRRYVRLTLVPFFSQIGDVTTFTFEGSETTTNSSNTTDQDDDGNNESDDNAETVVRSGTTVQLPTFEVISVSTTVSVPDGGTVLLGGIKRLDEARNEAGVPLLSKLPYVDRLFRNVGIGRATDSLMMMVTPHIIIQEEEEERRGITVGL